MAKRIQFRRGTTAQTSTFVGAPGEITVDTDKNVVVVHDGFKPGGYPAGGGSNATFSGLTTFNGRVEINDTTNSAVHNIGALLVKGSIGSAGNIVTAQTFIGTSNIPSTSTTTGNIIVAGGIGCGGRLTAREIVETSSIAFKENVNPLENALATVLQLTGVIYDRKDKSAIDETGLIAEAVNEVAPNLVTKDDNGKPYGVKYTKLVAYLIEAIKDQQKQIDELKNKG